MTTAVRLPSGTIHLAGDLVVPEHAIGLVLFAHASGSSRHGSSNQLVARQLQSAGMATLLLDLLTAEEEKRQDLEQVRLRNDIGLLASRLEDAWRWSREAPATRGLRAAFFGAGTGTAAALVVAARHPEDIAAVVSRGGRPDLAGNALATVRAPTLLVVGGHDTATLELNELALRDLTDTKRLVVITGATNLLEELGALEQVAALAGHWLHHHLTSREVPT